jgi:hypothetical protein
MYKLRHLFVTTKDLASSSPATRWNSHGRKDSIVLEQRALKPHFDVDELHVRQVVYLLAELWSKPVELS